MSWMVQLAIVVVFVAAMLVLVALARRSSRSGLRLGYPYELGGPLFTPAERSFLGVLDQAVGVEHRVFGKVRLADLAKVKSGLSRSAYQGALNRVAFKHVDFVVCRASDLSPVCAVELNDRSHLSKRAEARDELVSRVCLAIGLPLVTFFAKPAYVVSEVRSTLFSSEKPITPSGTSD